MKYLRKFNEDIKNECDFETFKEIMYDLSDYYQHSFKDYSNEVDPYYEIHINLSERGNYTIQDDAPYLNFEFVELSELDDPTTILRDFDFNDDVYSKIESQNNKLLEVKNRIDDIIRNNNQITDIFKKLESITPRFESFSNFQDVYVGFDKYNPAIRISFEIKKPETEKDNNDNEEPIGGDDWGFTPDQYPF